MRHLLGLGHRRIAVIDRSVAMLCSRARIDGYRAVLEFAGVEVDPALIRDGRRIWKASASGWSGCRLLDRFQQTERLWLRTHVLDGPHRLLDADSAVATDLRLGGLWVSGLMDTPGR